MYTQKNKERNGNAGIMVAGANSMGALGVIRSLGRAGYRVHAVASTPDAIGLYSNFATTYTVHPDANCPHFTVWARDFINRNNIRMIVPGGPVSPHHAALTAYKHLFPACSKNSSDVLARARKYELFECLLAEREVHGHHLPPTLLIDFGNELPSEEEISDLGAPLFIKLDAEHSTTRQGDRVIRLSSFQETVIELDALKLDYRKAVLQGFVPGQGIGVFLLRWNGKIIARFMHRRLHEMPHTGGASSLRESWWHDDIANDAEKKLDFIGWEGVAMIEYRWNPSTDTFYLMEMNLRFWGSIHLALYSGVDFPKLFADAFLGKGAVQENIRPVIGLKCRNTIPYEIGYLLSLWRDNRVSLWHKLYSLWEAVYLSLDLRVKNDLLFPGDRKLFWVRLGQLLKTGR